jgi:hypothetical protein
MLPEQRGGKAPLTNYQRRWLLRARFLNRQVWSAIGIVFLVGLLTKIGLPVIAFDLAGWFALPIFLGFMLFVFLNSCPRCGKNFYVNWIGIFGCANTFTRRCMNCGLSWKNME